MTRRCRDILAAAWTVALVLAIGLPLCGGEAPAPSPLANLDLARGLEGWTTWSGSTPHAYALDTAIGHAGRPSLRIDARDSTAGLMVMTAGRGLLEGQRYRLSVWWRTEGLSEGAQTDARCIFRRDDGSWLTGIDLHPYRQQAEGEWTLRQYRVSPPKGTAETTFGIWVRNGTGQVWVSDMSIEPLEAAARTYDSMLVYDPEQVPLQSAPLKAFYALQDAKSPFLLRALRWNGLMVEAARAQEDLSRARRVAVYRGLSLPAALAPSLDAALAELDRLQQAYGKLLVADTARRGEGGGDAVAAAAAAAAAQLDAPLEALAERLAMARVPIVAWLAGNIPAAGDDAWLAIPRARTDLPWWDAERGQPRYILWMRWSDARFHEFEEPLDMGDGFTLTTGAPATFEKGVAGWQNYLDQRAGHEAAGIRRSALITHYALHDKGYLAPEFVRQAGDDPDLRLWDAAGKPVGAPSGVTQFNWLNPRARAHMVDVLTQMADFFRERPEYQFYIDCWESAGPYVQQDLIGRNPSHLEHFRAYLAQRYGTIAELNRRWGAAYGSFAELQPADGAPVSFGEAVPALSIETRRWAQEAYVDYAKLIRDSIAARDPAKPVIAQHSGILSRVMSPRLWETADILGHHNRARTTMPVQLWLSSTQRYTRKPTALFENFWGCQEDHPARLHDEAAMRAQMRRYVYRHAAWGRCMQTWWYAYTSAPYLLTYNGNWFNPAYDLTTLRYSAAGFPVEKAKIDRVEALLLTSEIAPSRLLILQPGDTMLAQGARPDAYDEWLAWHALLFPRNQLYETLPDAWFASGVASFDSADVVILPAATHLAAAVATRLIDFARAGGTLVGAGPPGLYDDCGQPQNAILAAAGLQARFTQATGEPWRVDYGVPVGPGGWAEVPIGKGRLVLLPTALGRMPDAAALAARLREWVTPAAEAPGTTLELLLRLLPDGRALLCALNRDPDRATAGAVAVRGRYSRVADIDQPRPCLVPSAQDDAGRTAFRVALDPGGTAFYLMQ